MFGKSNYLYRTDSLLFFKLNICNWRDLISFSYFFILKIGSFFFFLNDGLIGRHLKKWGLFGYQLNASPYWLIYLNCSEVYHALVCFEIPEMADTKFNLEILTIQAGIRFCIFHTCLLRLHVKLLSCDTNPHCISHVIRVSLSWSDHFQLSAFSSIFGYAMRIVSYASNSI